MVAQNSDVKTTANKKVLIVLNCWGVELVGGGFFLDFH